MDSKPPARKRLSLIPATLGWTQICSTIALGVVPTGILWLLLQTHAAQELWLEAIRTFGTMTPRPSWVPWLVEGMNHQNHVFQGAVMIQLFMVLTGVGLILRWPIARYSATLTYLAGAGALFWLVQKSEWFLREVFVVERSIPQEYQAPIKLAIEALGWGSLALIASFLLACALLWLPHVRREFSAPAPAFPEPPSPASSQPPASPPPGAPSP